MMIIPRTLIGAAVAVAFSASVGAAVARAAQFDDSPRAAWRDRYQEARQGPEQTEKFSGTYRLDGPGAVDVSQMSGDVRVTAGRGNEVRVDAVKRVRHRDPEEARQLLSALRIEVTQVGPRLEIRTIYPRINRGFSGSVDYTLVVPQDAALAVKTVSGDVVVSGVRGEVRAETISGDVEVSQTPNLALAKTVSGDVRARDIAAAALTLGTVSGTVVATALKVRTLDASSVSGDLQLSNLQADRITAKTLSGEIVFDGRLARGGRYEFHAHSGNLRVLLPPDTSGFELDASTFSGTVRTEFPVSVRSTARDEPGRRGPAVRTIRGTFGDASAILALRSFSGNVVIAKR